MEWTALSKIQVLYLHFRRESVRHFLFTLVKKCYRDVMGLILREIKQV